MSLRSRRDHGSVIIFVLGIVLLAAFLLTRLMDRATVELAAENKAARRTELRQEAASALEASLAVLADYVAVDRGLFDPRDGWGRPLAALDYHPGEGLTADVTAEDESGRLSLPRADDARLVGYLEAIGCPAAEVDRLMDALLTWTKPDHLSLEGADLDLAAAPLPYDAPRRALRSFEELRAIPAARELFFDEQGRWNELGLRFKSGVSLFAFTNTNVNTAGAEVLLAHGLDPARISGLEAARAARSGEGAVYRTAAELAGAWGRDGTPPGLGTEAQCLRLMVDVRRGGMAYRLCAWVSRPGAVGTSATAPPRRETAESAKPREPASVRAVRRNKFDSPFRILELREVDDT